MVSTLYTQGGDDRPLGQNWIEGFIKRNPSIQTKVGKRIEASRFNGATPEAIDWFFDVREGHYDWIDPDNSYNADKGGIMAGFGTLNTSL